MPAKKSRKKGTVKKSTKKLNASKTVRSIHSKQHIAQFTGVLVLFLGFSLYAMGSFFFTTGDHIDNMQASVIDSLPEAASEDIPASCYECPTPRNDFAACESLWEDGICPLDTEGAQGDIFTDLPADHPNAEAVEALYYAGLVGGYGDGTSGVDNPILRAEFSKVVVDAVDGDISGDGLFNCFSDVGEDWYAPYICFLKNEGVMSGDVNGNAYPSDVITRGATVKMALDLFGVDVPEGVDEPPYSDLEVGSWESPYAYAAMINGIIDRYGKFDSNREMTRGEAFQIIYDTMRSQGLL